MPRSRPGKAENKFGIPISVAREVYREAAALPGLEVAGLDMHIGSQITTLEPFDNAFALVADFLLALREDGHKIEHVDLGGGLGIPYQEGDDPETITRCAMPKWSSAGSAISAAGCSSSRAG